MKANAFELFLLYRAESPATRLPFIQNGKIITIGKPHPWAAHFIGNLWNEGQHLWEDEVVPWAVVENLNYYSIQRQRLPDHIAKHLKGSGRWAARDQGGHYALLLNATIEWVKDKYNQWRWEILAQTMPDLEWRYYVAFYEKIREIRIIVEEMERVATCAWGDIYFKGGKPNWYGISHQEYYYQSEQFNLPQVIKWTEHFPPPSDIQIEDVQTISPSVYIENGILYYQR